MISLIQRIRIEKNNMFRDMHRSMDVLRRVNHKDRLLVFANGPSLLGTLNEKKVDFLDEDIICVNSFPNTEYYVEIKPSFFVLFDPCFFLTESLLSSSDRTMIDNVRRKTDWRLFVIIPEYAKNSFLCSELEKNSNIKICLCSDYCIPFNKEENEVQLFKLLRNDKIAMPSQTVSCAAIALGIYMDYSNIDIYGLDMSMIKEINVEQKTNRVYLDDNHFYNKGEHPLYVNSSVGWFLNAYATMFLQMEFLNRYAAYCGVSINNRSAFSYVDAFARGSEEG